MRNNTVLFMQDSIIKPDTSANDSVNFDPDSTRYYYLSEDSVEFAEILLLTPVLVFHKQYPTSREQSKFNRTKRIVMKIWPYYITALQNMAVVDEALVFESRRRKKRKLVKAQQKELRLEFEDELRKLTVTEGQTLIKMIERKTDMPFYDLIKQYRGTFEALKWNTLAFTLGYSLKEGYIPEDWEYLEVIMQAIESN